jgi:hypothetical protein
VREPASKSLYTCLPLTRKHRTSHLDLIIDCENKLWKCFAPRGTSSGHSKNKSTTQMRLWAIWEREISRALKFCVDQFFPTLIRACKRRHQGASRRAEQAAFSALPLWRSLCSLPGRKSPHSSRRPYIINIYSRLANSLKKRELSQPTSHSAVSVSDAFSLYALSLYAHFRIRLSSKVRDRLFSDAKRCRNAASGVNKLPALNAKMYYAFPSTWLSCYMPPFVNEC